MKRSARPSKPSVKYSSDQEDGEAGPRKRCACAGCPCIVPICFARSSERCAGNGWTPRWYHVSAGEHYCNECFEYFYRSHKDGYAEYASWKLQWSSKSRTVASVRGYFCAEILPYWAQCQRPACGRWRQLSKDVGLNPEFIESFHCGALQQNSIKKGKQDPCSNHEDERVKWVEDPSWLSLCRYTPYLQNCLATPFLTAYYPDGVGFSPTDTSKKSKEKFWQYQQPFLSNATSPLHAFAFTPDMMLVQEIEAFPLAAKESPYLYLGVRNLILVLWAINPKEWLTLERCMREVMCRGLARLYSVQLLPHILAFLTKSQAINVGLVTPPTNLLSQVKNTQESVVVIGAGISGLAAAHTLRSHGIQVTVVEARDHVGGRLGPTLEWSCGHVLTGVTNNPLALMTLQTELLPPLQSVKGACHLIREGGKAVDSKIDRRIEFHYNAILDIVSDWRKGREKEDDVSLAEKFKEFHQEFIRESQQYFNDEEEQIIQFHLCNLEFACGCSIDELSSLHWDHNESLPQFAGDHVIFSEGFDSILDKLSEGLDVRFNHKVTSVDYGGQGVKVHTENGVELKADKVVLSLPLEVLKSDCIQFQPGLPPEKRHAIDTLGSGKVEMVVVKFPHNFWSKTCPGHRMFGRVPVDSSQHGIFNIFQGISTLQADSTPSYLLISYIVGSKVDEIQSKTDKEVVTLFMDTLKTVFTNKTIPDPSWSLVTRWCQDSLAKMSYSYVPVGCDGSFYDLMAQDIDGKLFFAGEATNRQFPQTVTGAYISGVREGRKIIQWE